MKRTKRRHQPDSARAGEPELSSSRPVLFPSEKKKKKKKERKKNPKGVDISQAGLPDSGALLPPERGFHETVMLKDTPTRRDWLLGTEL